jgi:23S rRNA (uracil1939-C5)-methyltransferase
VRILRLAAGGDGVGRLPDGKTVFVPRTAPGDLVEITRVREHKRFARARLGQLIESSPHRIEPRCPHYTHDECGGCQLQHVDSETQRESRRALVGEAIRRLGRREVPDPPLEPAARDYDYRTKLTLHVAPGGRPIGLHRYDRADQLFDLTWCHITVPPLMELWQTVRQLRSLLPSTTERIVLRLDRQGGRHLVIRVGEGEVWSGADRLGGALRRERTPVTVWYQPAGGAARAVAGATEAFPATVFEQINPEMGDRVRNYAIEQLGPLSGKKIWDLYAGVGETTIRLVALGGTVESVELDRRAVAEAEASGTRAHRLAGRVEHVVHQLTSPDLVITNPPRIGMHERVTAELERVRPSRLIYISCDPATLARDLKRLPSFALVRLQAFDLFPQTAHVETVATLEPA